MLKIKLLDKKDTDIAHYIFGLSRENLIRLAAGRPILFEGKDIGMEKTGSIMIMFGETEAAIQDMIERQLKRDKKSSRQEPAEDTPKYDANGLGTYETTEDIT